MIRYIESREETLEFLESKGFEYYVPRKNEKMNACQDKDKFYYIEMNENNKIEYCSLVVIENDTIIAQQPFYDCVRVHHFPKKEEGELNYRKMLELKEFLY